MESTQPFKNQRAVDSRFLTYIGSLAARLVEKVFQKTILQPVFHVNPIGIVMVHPVNLNRIISFLCP